jgi:O-antigen/teichoic acid export membrane protein
MIKTNLSSSIDLVNGSLPVLIVGAALSPAAASFLQIAINATNILAHPTNMLNQATYPELAQVAAAKGPRKMAQLAFRSILVAVGMAAPVVLAFLLLRDWVAVLIAGRQFLPAGPLIALMALGQPLRIASVVLDSAVLARGRAGASLAAQGAGALAHLGFLFALMPVIGAAAAPLALIIGRTGMVAILTLRTVSD